MSSTPFSTAKEQARKKIKRNRGHKLSSPQNKVKRFIDGGVAVLETVRKLRNTCPGCHQPSGSLGDREHPSVRDGIFTWHQVCRARLMSVSKTVGEETIEDKITSNGVIKEMEADLSEIVTNAIAVNNNRKNSLYYLRGLALTLKDKYNLRDHIEDVTEVNL